MLKAVADFWTQHGPAISKLITGADTTLDAIQVLHMFGFLRESKRRRDEKVVHESFMPRFAIKNWHRNRNARLRENLSSHQDLIITGLMMKLHEEQQNELIVKMANESWDLDEVKARANFLEAVKHYEKIANMPDNDTRIAYLDSIDYIKDPATEYFLVWAEEKAEKVFQNTGQLLIWILTHPAEIRQWLGVDKINHIIGVPAPVYGPIAKPIYYKSLDRLERMRVRLAAAKQ